DRSPNCVVFPEPSIPSTTNSLPGYSCGLVRLFSMGRGTHFDAQRFAEEPLERLRMPAGRPELELRVAAGPDLEESVLVAIVKIDARDDLRVTAIEAFRETQDRRERLDDPPPPPRQLPIAFVFAFRRGAPMVAGDECDRFDFVGIEPAQVAVLDQIVRMFVMPFVADVDADVVQDGRVLQPLALAIGEPVDRAGLVEERRRKPRDLRRMLRPVVAALGELDDAPPAHVRIAVGLRDLLAVARDVIEDQTFAEGKVAERELSRPETPHDRVEDDRAGDGQVGAARLETRNAQTSLKIERDEL